MTNSPTARTGPVVLVATLGLVAIVWLFVLPQLARHPQIEQRIRFQKNRGIEPAAMFYSDSPAAQTAQKRFQRAQEEHPGLFWNPVAPSTIRE